MQQLEEASKKVRSNYNNRVQSAKPNTNSTGQSATKQTRN